MAKRLALVAPLFLGLAVKANCQPSPVREPNGSNWCHRVRLESDWAYDATDGIDLYRYLPCDESPSLADFHHGFVSIDRTSLAQYVAIFNRLNSLGLQYVPYLNTSRLAYRLLATLLGINRTDSAAAPS
jgi:hypothetical protein